MRLHMSKRSAFIAETLRRALEDQRRWHDVVAALGTIADRGHEWDGDPAQWVRRQRQADTRSHSSGA